MKNRKNSFQLIISSYESLSGVIGVVLVLYATFVSANFLDNKLLFIAGLGIAFFVLNIIAGVLLYKNEPLGIQLSLLSQIIQLITFSTSTFKYVLGCGAFLGIGYESMIFSIKSELFHIEYFISNSPESSSFFYLNIVSFVLIVYLFLLMPKQKS